MGLRYFRRVLIPRVRHKPDDLIKEINQRACKLNIVHGLPEPKISVTNLKRHDTIKISLIVTTLCPDMSTNHLILFRLGSPSSSNKGPIKVIFMSEWEAREVIENFNREIIAAAEKEFGDVGVTRDRTIAERKMLKALRNDLEAWTRDVKKDLTIKYIFGLPAITKLKSKN